MKRWLGLALGALVISLGTLWALSKVVHTGSSESQYDSAIVDTYIEEVVDFDPDERVVQISRVDEAKCQALPESFKAAIAGTNKCETDTDCMYVGGACPFGCGFAINREEEDLVRTAVKVHVAQYKEYCASICRYTCRRIYGLTCDVGQCKALMQQPRPDWP